MPRKRPQFVNGEIYHVIQRGIAGQKTFLEEKDYLRYFFNLYKFNDKEISLHSFRHFHGRGVTPTRPPKLEQTREQLIETLGFCLMSNHIHLLVRQVAESGVSSFVQKMGGYSTYFNKKYERFGSLFQRPFKAVHIKTNDQLLIVTTYIHLNPIDLIEPNWKIEGVSNPQKVIEFLESYPWSSYPHYLGKENFSWLIDSSFLNEVFEETEGFKNFVQARIFHKAELKSFLETVQKFSLE